VTEKVEPAEIERITGGTRSSFRDVVIPESPCSIILNNRELTTLLCSPADRRYLAVGFLFSEGLLSRKDDIKRVVTDNRRGVVRVDTTAEVKMPEDLLFKRVITSGCGRGVTFYNTLDAAEREKIDSSVSLSSGQVIKLAQEFGQRSELFRLTGGVHGAALCDETGVKVFHEDIGRHNAIDKVFGECLLKDIPVRDGIIVTSGRISSEIMHKISRGSVPVLISRSAPTSLAVRLADDWGITLVGFVRGQRMNIYTNGWRIITDGG
jgi:FdhD protein